MKKINGLELIENTSAADRRAARSAAAYHGRGGALEGGRDYSRSPVFFLFDGGAWAVVKFTEQAKNF